MGKCDLFSGDACSGTRKKRNDFDITGQGKHSELKTKGIERSVRAERKWSSDGGILVAKKDSLEER